MGLHEIVVIRSTWEPLSTPDYDEWHMAWFVSPTHWIYRVEGALDLAGEGGINGW